MKTIHDYVCRVAKKHYQSNNPKPLYLVTTAQMTQSVRNALGALLEPNSYSGSSWKMGRSEVLVRSLDETPPSVDFELAICNDGERLTMSESDRAAAWRKAAR